MDIIRDERTIETVGTCAQCGEVKPGRPVKSCGDTFTPQSRGTWFICLSCFAPRIFWRDDAGRDFFTPAALPQPSKKAKTHGVDADLPF